eukprot:11182190-Alexandrium_andersonii.AAC.1
MPCAIHATGRRGAPGRFCERTCGTSPCPQFARLRLRCLARLRSAMSGLTHPRACARRALIRTCPPPSALSVVSV